jgi:hypothetical protein
MDDPRKDSALSSNFGIKLNSQYSDPLIYETIRKIQDALNRSLGVPVNRIQLTEYRIGRAWFYELRNKKLELKGFVGRCNHSGKIVLLIKDRGRIEWAKKEGFLSGVRGGDFQRVIYSDIGILIQVESPGDMALFLAGLPGYRTRGPYIKA